MEGSIVSILFIMIALCFASLFLLQRRNLKKVKKQLTYIYEYPDRNLRLKLPTPDKDLEALLMSINQFLELYQNQQIHHEKSEKKLKQEIANISHDLRTPLTSILGYMSLLEEENVSEAEKKDYLTIIRKKGEVMKTLVESFYELSSVEAEDYVLKKDEIYLYNTICEILLAFYQDFEKKKIEVILDLDENIPVVILDKHAILRIITNLIQNSLRYATGFLKISLKKEEDKINLTFSNDTGAITPSDMEQIFERTYRGDHARNAGGTGLGLSITKKLVELQQGEVKAELREGIFIIQLVWSFQDILKNPYIT